MCTVFFAWQTREDYPLIVASNRDEFHQRPTSAASWQGAGQSAGQWFGGRDEKDGGSWLGVAKSGRFAVITNFRDPDNINQQAPSRGGLVSRWLEGEAEADFCSHLEQQAQNYNGFNLLFGDTQQLYYFSSAAADKVQTLEPGFYGLSNGLLDEAWPKVKLGKRRFEGASEVEVPDLDVLTGLMHDQRQAPDESLPKTGVPVEWERMLSSLFIVSPAYGTRATTIFTISQLQRCRFQETRFDENGQATGETKEEFALEVS